MGLLPLLLALCPTQAQDDEATLRARAERCGSELAWAPDWTSAAERAQNEHKLVLVSFQNYPGFELGDLASSGPFMDEEIVEVVRTSCVPLRFRLGMEAPFTAPEVYGMGPKTFGVALLLVAPEGNVLAETFALESTVVRAFLRNGLAARATSRSPDADHAPRTPEELEAARLAALGRLDEAAEHLARPVHLTPSARFLAARLLLARGREAEGLAALRTLALAEPETRWSWLAATLTLNPLLLGPLLVFAPPSPELVAEGLAVARAPLAAGEDARARVDALRWLLTRQRADGSWPAPSDLTRTSGAEPYPLALGGTALAGLALARAARRPPPGVAAADCSSAAARALAFLVQQSAARRQRAVHPPEVLMDYTVWSFPCALLLASELPSDEREPVLALAREALDELARKRKRDGGWSYYLSGSAAGSATPYEISMSFTTALALRALGRCDSLGLDARDLTEGAADSLEGMRRDDGRFVYLKEHTTSFLSGGTPGDAAGRGPGCTLALLEAGRAEPEQLRTSLARFVEHLPLLAREQGKALMHCGPEGEGSHYLLFDYWQAAEAVASLQADERAPFVPRLAGAVLAARNADGSFVDNPMIGRAAGTAMALLALEALGRE